MRETVYQIITERVISLLEKGTVPWHKPWKGGGEQPQNLVSRKPYRGINVFLLHSLSYASPFWLSYKQAQSLGGTVRKGEKACPVVFWKWLDPKESSEEQGAKRIPLLRYYSVFNVLQCDGIEFPTDATSADRRQHDPISEAEAIVQSMPKRPVIRQGMTRAFYSPGEDLIGIPSPEDFTSSEEFYSTLFHELTHSTGHSSRLNRKGILESAGFGSKTYSHEELIAEMGAAFLCGQAGIVERTLDNSAAYIGAWLERLRKDAKLVVQAAAQAQKAADFILGKEQPEESRIAA